MAKSVTKDRELDPRAAESLFSKLVKEKRMIDLGIELLRFRVLPLEPLDVVLENREDEKQVLLVAPSGKVLMLPNGRRIFEPNYLMELEEYVLSGLRQSRFIRNDVVWALVVGLTGLFGLIIASLVPRLRRNPDRSHIERWIDEKGNTVFVAKDPGGFVAHLMTVSYDRRYLELFEPLVNSVARSGYYILKFSYPASVLSWTEALGVEVDPRIDVIVDPTVFS